MTQLGEIHVLRPGPLSTIQDFGRFGYGSLGISRGGPMDEHAFAWANHLLMNNINTPVIEISMGGFEIQFCSDSWIAVTGADMGLTIDGVKAEQWRTHFVEEDSIVKLRGGRVGMFAYLAVGGGIYTQEVLGSVSRSIQGHALGIEVSLKRASVVSFVQKSNDLLDSYVRRTPWDCIQSYSDHTDLSFVPSPCWDCFSAEEKSKCLENDYEISMDSNRMGYRLIPSEGVAPKSKAFRSEGLGRGTIQLPPDGQPIVMMNDHQTIGGYPILGCLTHESCNRLAQGRPGDNVRFAIENIAVAQAKRMEFLRFFR